MRQSASAAITRRMFAGTVLLCVGLLALAYLGAQDLDVIFVPTPRKTVDRMLAVAKVGPEDYLIDLGSGDGRIAIAAARRGARALGVDLDPARIRDAELDVAAAGVADRVSFRLQNLFETDIAPATVLTMYLLPSINMKLRPKILGLRPGTRVVSHDFAMGDWRPDVTDTISGPVYLWIVPARIAGQWQIIAGDRRFDLSIEQTHQAFRGSAIEGGQAAALRNTRLRGGSIEFSAEWNGKPETFRGVVDGDTMQGRTDAGVTWSATRS